MCKSDLGNQKMEAFQGNMDTEVKAASAIFCEPLNGWLIEFPTTFEKFKEIYDFQIRTMQKKTLNEMSITVNARSLAAIIEKPFIIKFDRKKSNLSEIESLKLIKPEREVLNFISKAQKSYQTKEELCFIMTTSLDGNSTESMKNSIITNQMCNTYGDWWTVCE